MEKIQHSHVQVRGLKLHLVQTGTGPKVSYRAVAFDFRGYGLPDHPPEPERANFNGLAEYAFSYSVLHTKYKTFGLFVDFGAFPAFTVAVTDPERVLGVITLGVPFLIPGPLGVQFDLLPKGYYVIRWAEPGRAEADFGRFDVKTVVRNIYILFCRSELQVAGDNEEIMDLVDPSTPLPPWFTEEDLDVYATLYQNSGFRTALQAPYRCMQLDCGITNPKVIAPSLLTMGEKDYVMKSQEWKITLGKG
uniref:Uncharacterized protein n=1 Tax=Gossypium raimondii TaxID=29730 RepID=A0A0D2TNS3_GOSRA|nr:hypothetical protein B456_012G129700 [Gossypium raimondii]